MKILIYFPLIIRLHLLHLQKKNMKNQLRNKSCPYEDELLNLAQNMKVCISQRVVGDF